jgi:hypothetical protein
MDSQDKRELKLVPPGPDPEVPEGWEKNMTDCWPSPPADAEGEQKTAGQSTETSRDKVTEQGQAPEEGKGRHIMSEETYGDSAVSPESASETTSISLPPLVHEEVVDYQLSPAEREFVAALSEGSALLIAHSGPNRGARFLLDQEVTTVGRHPSADIFLDDVTVSRRHAEFRRENGQFSVVDAGSLNGTYVNHDRVDAAQLRNGAEVQIGKFRLTFYVGTRPARQGVVNS